MTQTALDFDFKKSPMPGCLHVGYEDRRASFRAETLGIRPGMNDGREAIRSIQQQLAEGVGLLAVERSDAVARLNYGKAIVQKATEGADALLDFLFNVSFVYARFDNVGDLEGAIRVALMEVKSRAKRADLVAKVKAITIDPKCLSRTEREESVTVKNQPRIEVW